MVKRKTIGYIVVDKKARRGLFYDTYLERFFYGDTVTIFAKRDMARRRKAKSEANWIKVNPLSDLIDTEIVRITVLPEDEWRFSL